MKTGNKLYWKISITLLLLLIILGIGYILISSYTSNRYFQEVNQRLYGDIASHLVKETKPLVNGVPDTTATHDIMHSMMVINPSSEVYLLNPEGKIIDYVVPGKSVELESVDLKPVKEFIDNEGKSYVLGDDPRNEGEQKVFSAAPIFENEQLSGYAYIILASEKQTEIAGSLFSSYILKSGVFLFFTTLAVALLVGLIAIWYLTRSLREIIKTFRRFKEGDYSARISGTTEGDFHILSGTFNEMADTISGNIEQLQSIERLRRELIANVSHDLRTPLAIMQGYIETLLMKKDKIGKEAREKYLNIVFNSSKKLSGLVGQLFEYSKLEANEIQPEKEAFQLSDLAQDVVAKYKILTDEKKIKLELDAENGLPMVFADLGLVERVIQNLMDNALKFTPENGTIQLQLKKGPESVEVCIADSGPGIPEEDQAHIFERYRKTTNTASSTNKGAGLGLAIVKKILDIHNSTIKVSSRLNEGAEFIFNLPTTQPAYAQ